MSIEAAVIVAVVLLAIMIAITTAAFADTR